MSIHWQMKKMPLDVSHHFRVDRHISVLIVFIFHFFIRHELDSAMANAKHAGNETLSRMISLVGIFFQIDNYRIRKSNTVK